MKNHAALTGDIIGSSKLGQKRLNTVMNLLRRLASDFDQVHPGSVVGSLDVFRGDSWQLCLQRPALAVTAAVFIRAGLKSNGSDARIGIGWGGVNQLVPEHISESVGPAFTNSGRALDELHKGRSLAVALSNGQSAHFHLGILDAGLGLLDALISRWTRREAVAVHGTMLNLSQEAVAALPQSRTKAGSPPTRQAIQDALRRVSWANHIQPFLSQTEQFIEMEVAHEEE